MVCERESIPKKEGDCGLTSASPCKMNEDHERVNHIEQKFLKCSLCDFQVFSAKRLRHHLKAVHENNQGHQSQECSERTIQRQPPPVQKKLKPFKCTKCDYRTKLRKALKNHLHKVHAKYYECAECGHKEKWKTRLRRHINSAHKVKVIYLCHWCDLETPRKKDLQEHARTCHPKILACSKCDFRATLQRDLTLHLKQVHETVKQFTCTECEYATNRSSALKTHLQNIHKLGKKYECKICRIEFARRGELWDHIGGLHRQCFQCDYTSTKFTRMLNHYQAQHLRRKVNNCSECNYSARTIRSLQRHVNMKHARTEVFFCSDCDFNSQWEESVNVHKAKVHKRPRVAFDCSLCGYEGKQSVDLEEHIAAAHSNSSSTTEVLSGAYVFKSNFCLEHKKGK